MWDVGCGRDDVHQKLTKNIVEKSLLHYYFALRSGCCLWQGASGIVRINNVIKHNVIT